MDRRSAAFATRLAGYIGAHVTRIKIERADDRLSKAASVVAKINRDWNEGAEYDSVFDAGEWSLAASERGRCRDIEAALTALGFTSQSFEAAVTARSSWKTVYRCGLIGSTMEAE